MILFLLMITTLFSDNFDTHKYYQRLISSGSITKKEIISTYLTDNYLYISENKIRKYLHNNYKSSISAPDIINIAKNIFVFSEKYKINPVVLLSVLENETHFQHNIFHPLVTIRVKGKKLKIKAVGMGGVVYEIWEDELREHNIIKNRNDLLKIKNNIESTAYILSKYFRTRKIKNYSSFKSGIIRYFGGHHLWYYKRIIKTMKIFIINYEL